MKRPNTADRLHAIAYRLAIREAEAREAEAAWWASATHAERAEYVFGDLTDCLPSGCRGAALHLLAPVWWSALRPDRAEELGSAPAVELFDRFELAPPASGAPSGAWLAWLVAAAPRVRWLVDWVLADRGWDALWRGEHGPEDREEEPDRRRGRGEWDLREHTRDALILLGGLEEAGVLEADAVAVLRGYRETLARELANLNGLLNMLDWEMDRLGRALLPPPPESTPEERAVLAAIALRPDLQPFPGGPQ